MLPKEIPKDLALIKEAFETVIVPAIEEGNYISARITAGNVLSIIDKRRIALREHCGLSLVSNLEVLEQVLHGKDPESIQEMQRRVRAYLGQSLMYYYNPME